MTNGKLLGWCLTIVVLIVIAFMMFSGEEETTAAAPEAMQAATVEPYEDKTLRVVKDPDTGCEIWVDASGTFIDYRRVSASEIRGCPATPSVLGDVTR